MLVQHNVCQPALRNVYASQYNNWGLSFPATQKQQTKKKQTHLHPFQCEVTALQKVSCLSTCPPHLYCMSLLVSARCFHSIRLHLFGSIPLHPVPNSTFGFSVGSQNPPAPEPTSSKVIVVYDVPSHDGMDQTWCCIHTTSQHQPVRCTCSAPHGGLVSFTGKIAPWSVEEESSSVRICTVPLWTFAMAPLPRTNRA